MSDLIENAHPLATLGELAAYHSKNETQKDFDPTALAVRDDLLTTLLRKLSPAAGKIFDRAINRIENRPEVAAAATLLFGIVCWRVLRRVK